MEKERETRDSEGRANEADRQRSLEKVRVATPAATFRPEKTRGRKNGSILLFDYPLPM